MRTYDHDAVAQRWLDVCRADAMDLGLACARCHSQHTLGQLLMVFGDVENVRERASVLCDECGMFAIEMRDLFPTATAVFVPRTRRFNSFDKLTRTERDAVAETFERLDRLTEGLAAVVRRTTSPAPALPPGVEVRDATDDEQRAALDAVVRANLDSALRDRGIEPGEIVDGPSGEPS